MNNNEFTRKQFYDLVWSTPLSKIAKDYDFSYEGLKKLCVTFEIPIPETGHWMKLKHNKLVKVEKLEDNYFGKEKIVLSIRDKYTNLGDNPTPLAILINQIESDVKAPLTVPEKLSNPDILIQNTKLIHDKRKKEHYYRDDKTDSLSISVEDSHFNRAVRIMDTLIKLLRHRGHTFRRDRNNYGPHIVINDVEFHFYLREVQKRIPSKKLYESSSYLPTGILVLKIGESYKAKEWKDGKIPIEKQLAKIVAKMELDAQKELEWREECRLDKIQREEEKKLRIEFEARKEKELAKTMKLFSDAEKFQKAIIYRNFIKAREQKAISENNLTEELINWLKWANDKADWYDPLVASEDELLTDNEKDDINKPKQSTNNYKNW
jgi:hypothetical protein